MPMRRLRRLWGKGTLMPVDLPPIELERVTCSIEASRRYQIPANVLLAIAEIEGGRPGQWIANTNGTHDVGPMQFNTAYLADLERYGITVADVAADGCYPYDLAAWRLRGHLRETAGDVWTRVAYYHSRTPRYNAVYRAKVITLASKWADWLQSRFNTTEVR